MNRDAFNTIVLTLLEAEITLYPAKPDGTPMLSSPLYAGSVAENLNVTERWLKQRTTPTGARAPKNHPLVPEYQVTIGRLWNLPLDQLDGFNASHTDYVLDVVWKEEESGQWHRRTFYGVTIGERTLETREFDSGHTDGQVWDAQYFNPSSGTDAVPALSETLPYRVTWTGSDGHALLYTYDAATHLFTAVGTTTGRATIAYDTGVWKVTFTGEAGPTVISTEAGLEAVFLQRMPTSADLPRLDFFYGPMRVATITPDGLWAREFKDTVSPAAGTARYQIYNAADLVATLDAARVTADEFSEP